MISVIIPIYNVEPYLKKCLDSLSAQTFTDVEFILIDDGSTDQSGEIASVYSDADSRFFVYHTPNHGLSAARNLGIEKARGEWLMFVDPDDYVMSDFCETPYEAAMRENADMVIFQWKMVGGWGSVARKNKAVVKGIVNPETAVRYGASYAWNKLYRRELFDRIRYPENRVFEDVATTHKLIFKANRILMLSNVFYYHVHRKDSISHSRTVKNARDAFLSSLERAEYLKFHGCDVGLYQSDICSRALILLALSKPGDDPLFQQAEAVADSISGIPPQLNKKKKLMLHVWKLDKRLFHLACRLLGLKASE